MVAGWEEELLYQEGDAYFQALIERISEAKNEIKFEVYIFRFDQVGRSILNALTQAVHRGVRVQLLVDGFGCLNWNRAMLARLKAQGIDVRIFHPFPWQIVEESHLRLRFFRRLIFLWRTINKRNHRKTAILDGQFAFVGGINVSSVHSKKVLGMDAWRDTAVQIKGPEVSFLKDAFEAAWIRHLPIKGPIQDWMSRPHTKNPSAKALPKWVRLNNRTARRIFLQNDLNERIALSSKRVWITTPYFVPSMGFLKALRRASKRGISVKILLPRQNDILFMRWVGRAYYQLLTPLGIEIYEYLPSTLHAKATLVDDWAMVGSTNFNSRSLIHDLEVDVVLSKRENIEALADQFLKDLQQSQIMNHAPWSLGMSAESFLGKLILRIKHWL